MNEVVIKIEKARTKDVNVEGLLGHENI